MFQLETVNRIPVRIGGRYVHTRLPHPYMDHRLVPHGLNGLDGFFDSGFGKVLKTFGSGVVQTMTAGMYDPRKNRFYVPFTGGQVRNWMQGFTNATTLGLVNTDKFFNSNTMRTVANVGAGIEAATVAYVGGSYLYDKFGRAVPTTTTAAPPPSGITQGLYPPTSSPSVTAPVQAVTSSSTLSTIGGGALKVLEAGAKILPAAMAGAAGGGGGMIQPQPQAPGGGEIPLMAPVPVDNLYAQTGGMYPPSAGGMLISPTGTMMPVTYGGGGGGGGFMTPAGTEFPVDPETAAMLAQQQQLQQRPQTMTWVIVGSGALILGYFLLRK